MQTSTGSTPLQAQHTSIIQRRLLKMH